MKVFLLHLFWLQALPTSIFLYTWDTVFLVFKNVILDILYCTITLNILEEVCISTVVHVEERAPSAMFSNLLRLSSSRSRRVISNELLSIRVKQRSRNWRTKSSKSAVARQAVTSSWKENVQSVHVVITIRLTLQGYEMICKT